MMKELFFGIGLFGLSGVSFLCPVLASLLYGLLRRRPAEPLKRSSGDFSLTIAVPLHNEEAHIGKTLDSIEAAILALERSPGAPAPVIRLVVGLDGCTDNTAERVRSFSRVDVREFHKNQGKWRTIESLLSGISTEWTLLADSGIQWPATFLTDFWKTACETPEALAIAPSYKPLQSGILSRLVWGFEVLLKRCEGWSGGPVSLHGATLGYKTAALKMALRRLSGRLWLNDDVVIPLMVRALHPQGVIRYPVGQVQDAAVRPDQLDVGRRRRMVRGNLQWVRSLWPQTFRQNPVVGVLAARRVFRLLWAYWIVFLAVAVGMRFPAVVLPSLVAGLAGLLSSGSVRQLAGAAVISLLSPWYMVRFSRHSEGAWS